jgi:hypothetical protein
VFIGRGIQAVICSRADRLTAWLLPIGLSGLAGLMAFALFLAFFRAITPWTATSTVLLEYPRLWLILIAAPPVFMLGAVIAERQRRQEAQWTELLIESQ